MPTFLDHLQKPNMDSIFVLRISGLPYLFANAPAPLGWESGGYVTYNGDNYRWLNILMTNEGISINSTKIEPKGGVGQSSSLDFNLLSVGYQSEGNEDDPLLSLILNTVNRGDEKYIASLKENLNADISGSGQSVYMIYNPWSYLVVSPTELDLYLGTETINISSISALDPDVITGTMTRGKYGSMPRDHVGKVVEGNKVSGGAMYIADYPLTMEGRFAELWCVPGDFLQDTQGRISFKAFAEDLSDTQNQLLYSGLVDGTHEDGMYITIRTSSLDQLLKGSVMTETPTLTINGGRDMMTGTSRFYLGPHNWHIHWDMRYNGYVASTIFIKILDNDDITAGDVIDFGGMTITEGTDWFKGVNTAATYVSIAGALNAVGPFSAQYIASVPTGSQDCVIITAKYGDTSTVTLSFTQTVSGNLYSNKTTFSGGLTNAEEFFDVRCVRSDARDGTPPFSDVTEGLYTLTELSEIFVDTVNSRLNAAVRLRGNFNRVVDGDASDPSKYRIQFDGYLNPYYVSIGTDIVFMTIHGQYQSFLRDLGFTDLEYEAEKLSTDENDLESLQASFRFKASKRPAVLRIPSGNYPPPSRIYIDVADSFAIDYFDFNSSLWIDHNMDPIPMICYIKDVGLFHFTDFPTSFVYRRYVSGVTRVSKDYGAWNKEEFYLEYTPDSDKTLDLVRVLNFSNCHINSAILFMLLSSVRELNDADYDTGWPGCGLAIPSRFVDTNSFLAQISQNPQIRDRFLVFPGDSIRELLDEELKASQQQIVADLGKLKVIDMNPSLEVYRSTATVVDDTMITTDPEKGIAVDRQSNRIVNVVKVMGSYDYVENKYYLEQINRKQDSIGTWGEKQELVIKLKGIGNTTNGEAVGKALSQQIFAIYGVPYAIFDVDVAVKESWLWEVGDEVSISHPALPHPTMPRRGAENIPCKIVGKKTNIFGSEKEYTTISLMSWALFGHRYSCWAPSARLTWTGSAWRVSESHYGGFLNGIYPSDYFQVGYGVRTHTVGDATKITTAVIATRTGSPGFVDITLSPNPSTTNAQIMTYDFYNSVDLQSDQKVVAYMSNFTGELYAYSGIEKPFKYL